MRLEIVKRGIIGLIVGLILAGFGWAVYDYRLIGLPYTVDDLLWGTGTLIAVIGIGYLIYGLIKKAPTPTTPTYTAPFSPPPQSHYPPTTSNIPPPPQPSPTPKFCTECGQPLNANDKFCGYCGIPLS